MTYWGTKIWDDTGYYFYTEIDVGQDLQHTTPSSVQDPYNAKYQFVTYNGNGFYYSGSCSGNFSDNKSGECYEDYNFTYREEPNGNIIYNVKYVDIFVQWLNNKKIKQLQLSKELVIPIKITSPIRWDNDRTVDDGYNIKISFDWTQAAPHYSLTDTGGISNCPTCGNMIAPSALYCPKCGNKVGGT